jgi:hypothetical protein
MKALKALLIIVAAIAAIFYIGAMFLPHSYVVSRSQVINAPIAMVYNNVANFNNFLKWNPWSRMEPSAQIEIIGDAGVPGHLYKWKGKEIGKGYMQLNQVNPNWDADFELVFEEPFRSEAKCFFNFEEISGGTKVTWNMIGQSEKPLDKWMYLNMDNMMGNDFESGLKNLKELSENKL